jgi:hypothetical protein
MGFLSNLFGKRQSANSGDAKCKVVFDENGKVLSVEAAPVQWAFRQNGQYKYYTQRADTLLHAAEILKNLNSIPQLTYYTVDTPDGPLGRDIQGFFTEAPLKTKNLKVKHRFNKPETVELQSLTGFGDMYANQTTVALGKKNGEYSQLVLMMKCGYCNYESPVETQPGAIVRECYCCGIKNNGQRGTINVFIGSNMVEI